MTYRDRPLQCPRCGGELVRPDISDHWRCTRCRGVLAGVSDVARRLVEVAPDLAPEGHIRDLPTLERRRTVDPVTCPACAAQMAPVFLGGLDVDRCYDDELLWFDPGELDHVLEIAATQHEDRHPHWLVRLVRAMVG